MEGVELGDEDVGSVGVCCLWNLLPEVVMLADEVAASLKEQDAELQIAAALPASDAFRFAFLAFAGLARASDDPRLLPVLVGG